MLSLGFLLLFLPFSAVLRYPQSQSAYRHLMVENETSSHLSQVPRITADVPLLARDLHLSSYWPFTGAVGRPFFFFPRQEEHDLFFFPPAAEFAPSVMYRLKKKKIAKNHISQKIKHRTPSPKSQSRNHLA